MTTALMGNARSLCWVLALVALGACVRSERGEAAGPRQRWAIAIHGGAGAKPDATQPQLEAHYRAALTAALKVGTKILEGGGTSLDAVEAAVVVMEDEPLFNAGRGAVFTNAGGHTLDASIMSGKDARCGAVAGVTTVRNPIKLARKVITQTRHVLLAGSGAERLAEELGFVPVPNSYFSTERRREQWKRKRGDSQPVHGGKAGEKGTVGAVALDAAGNLAAATSTGGLTNKKYGRIGDSPIIGAGTYADNRSCAVSATGTGEEFIRHSVARSIAARMELAGATLQEAVGAVVLNTLKPGDGGVIAVDHRGNLAATYSTPAMVRGAADASGRFEVRVWD